MAPLIYVAATLPLFFGSATFLFVNLFLRTENGTLLPVVYTIAMWAIVVMILISLFMRSVRGTYGDRVAQVIIAASALMLTLGRAIEHPLYWVFVAIWLLLLSLDIWTLRRSQRLLRLTPAELWSPDSLSKRFIPGRPAPGGFDL